MFEKVSLPKHSPESTEAIRTASKIREDILMSTQGEESRAKEALFALDDAHLLMLDQELFESSAEAYQVLTTALDNTSVPTLIYEYGTHSVSPSEREERASIVATLRHIISS